MLEQDETLDLIKLVDQATYHSHLVDGRFISSVHVKVPVIGNESHLIELERSVLVIQDPSIKNEQEAAALILSRDVKYIYESATDWSTPVTQENEDGKSIIIGRAIIFIDRTRIQKPSLQELSGVYFIDMAG